MRRILPTNVRLFRNNTFFVVCGLAVLYFLVMDIRLYHRVRNFAIRKWTDEREYEPVLDCELDPLCTVTVKGMMLDYPNFYIFGPLAALFDRLVGVSSCWWITPNAISASHVFVALAAGQCVSMKSLATRRFGVLLFQLRSWLDDLDGFVARKRLNVSGERSETGTFGYYVDALCDTLGTIALLLGVFQYLKTYAPKHGYEKLQTILPTDQKSSGACIVYRKKLRSENIALAIVLIAGSLMAASITWNRYLYIFTDLLQTDFPKESISNAAELYAKRTNVFRLNSFWFISLLWRLTNPHALIDYLLIAVFIDRAWDYIDKAKWFSYGFIMAFAYLTEFYYHQTLFYVVGSSIRGVDVVQSVNIVASNTQF